nr:hypothetical protein [Natrinema sp. SYSU A 869]
MLAHPRVVLARELDRQLLEYRPGRCAVVQRRRVGVDGLPFPPVLCLDGLRYPSGTSGSRLSPRLLLQPASALVPSVAAAAAM